MSKWSLVKGEEDAQRRLEGAPIKKDIEKQAASTDIWLYKSPLLQSRDRIARMRLYEVGPKACEGASGSRCTVHVLPLRTAPQPVGISCESILRREENQSARRKTLVRTINNSRHTCPGPESNPVHSDGGAHAKHCTTLRFTGPNFYVVQRESSIDISAHPESASL